MLHAIFLDPRDRTGSSLKPGQTPQGNRERRKPHYRRPQVSRHSSLCRGIGTMHLTCTVTLGRRKNKYFMGQVSRYWFHRCFTNYYTFSRTLLSVKFIIFYHIYLLCHRQFFWGVEISLFMKVTNYYIRNNPILIKYIAQPDL